MKKLVSVLLTLAVAVSLLVVPAMVSAHPGGPELELTYDSGQNEINKQAGHPYIEWTIAGNEITFDFHNPLGSDYACAFDYRVDGEPGTWTEWSNIVKGGVGELAGQEIGPSYNIVNVGAETETVTVTASKEVKVGLRLQSESDWDLDWIIFEVSTSAVVGLTADVPDIVAINVDPTSIDFGTLIPGQISAVKTINVENIGTHTVDVDASLAAWSSDLFNDNLMLKNEPKDWTDWVVGTPWDKIVEGLVMGASDEVKTKLPVPLTYTPSNVESGLLIFEATPV